MALPELRVGLNRAAECRDRIVEFLLQHEDIAPRGMRARVAGRLLDGLVNAGVGFRPPSGIGIVEGAENSLRDVVADARAAPIDQDRESGGDRLVRGKRSRGALERCVRSIELPGAGKRRRLVIRIRCGGRRRARGGR